MKDDYDLFRLRVEEKLKDFCWVSDENKVVFFVIPKNASTAIRHSPLLKDSYRTTYEKVKNKIDDNGYRTFTVLREPVGRFISAYYEVLRGNREDNIYNTIINKNYALKKGELSRFIYFLEDIQKNGFFDSHIKPQVHFLTDDTRAEIKIQNYLFFDNISEEYYDFCHTFGLECWLPNENSFAKKNKEALLDYIKNNKIILNVINNLYKHDIILYNEKNNLTK